MTVSITLYQLAATPGSEPSFSPHVWKTRLDLEYLGIPYKKENLTFPEIRKDLAKATGNDKVTVPTLKLEDGKYITDSWEIAQYLEAKGTSKRSLFTSSAAGFTLARLIEKIAGGPLGDSLRPSIVPFVISRLDDASKEYFLRVKLGGGDHAAGEAKYKNLKANWDDESKRAESIKNIRAQFAPIESLLAEQQAKGLGNYIAGKEASHADFVLFGFYAFSSVNEELLKQTWKHESLSAIGKWVDTLLASGLVDKKALANVV